MSLDAKGLEERRAAGKKKRKRDVKLRHLLPWYVSMCLNCPREIRRLSIQKLYFSNESKFLIFKSNEKQSYDFEKKIGL